MSQATLALRKALWQSLGADAAITTRLGGARVYDEAPRQAALPYVAFGETTSRDASTSTDSAMEHRLVIHVYSAAHGMAEALEIAGLCCARVEQQGASLDGHRLASIAFVALDTARDRDGRVARVSLRFRALTETL